MKALLDFLSKLLRAIFGPGDKQDTGEATPAPAVPEAEAVTGWTGAPPYRFVDVSRFEDDKSDEVFVEHLIVQIAYSFRHNRMIHLLFRFAAVRTIEVY
jgi:hypothetical protein